MGDTGLSVTLTGDFNNLTTGFTKTSNKRWSFIAEAPFSFDMGEKINNLNIKYRHVERMFEYNRNSCNSTYENMWNQHFNDTYKLTGLLLAYVERMNLLWREM
jgi:hemolysin activation/secretion protein